MLNPTPAKAVVRAYVEAMNSGDFASLTSLFAPEAVIHGVLGHGSLEVALPIWRELHECLAMRLEITDMAEEGESVVVRFRETGKSIAPFRGMPATGKSFEVTAIEWFTVVDGRIVERWGVRDSSVQARQLGWSA
ncbi:MULTISPECIES: ester cyclase [Hyphomicrobiales]|uniref:ester cyclase n=1 Tax=Hyphomicrobiales TaxID=356 RepID=UPI000360D234|nr:MULTISPECIES: ester cyclase [Phyllobacteriaceae]MCX8571438.1 ester cyclase [Aminobacter sp. MET-1]